VQALPPFVGCEQARDPELGVHAVVDLLAVHLRGQPGDLGIVRGLERVQPDRVGRLVEEVARDRARPLEAAELDERRAPVLLRPPVERERVGVGAEVARSELVQRPRVSDLVLGDRRECDVLLEERRDARPLRVAPAEHELVVGQLEQEVSSRPRCPLAHAPPSAAP
jgi:hypothetical protein